MIFTTYWFVLFISILLPFYWLIKNPQIRILILLVSCIIFHGHFAGAAGVLPIAVVGLTTYLIGLSGSRLAHQLGILLCVLTLCFYKYAEFLFSQVFFPVSPLATTEILSQIRLIQPETPPLAISFFIFEFVHYLYDLMKG